MKKIVLLLSVAGLCSCSIPASPAVSAHAAGEVFSPVTFAAKGATGASPEASKAHDFWGGAAR